MYLGSVYVYESVGNIWSRQCKLLAADGAGSDYFGASVSIYGTTAMIGHMVMMTKLLMQVKYELVNAGRSVN
jgi:hypothetical protein